MRFWGRAIKWAFWRWEKAGTLMAMMLSLINWTLVLVGIGGAIGASITGQWAWLITLVPLFLMVVLVAPYAIWKPLNQKLEQLTAKRLQLGLDEQREGTDTYSLWYRIRVTNPASEAIDDCYGLIREFKQLYPKYLAEPYARFPASGHRLPWAKGSSEGGECYRQTILGNNIPAYLDLAHTNNPSETRLRISSPSREGKQPEMDAYQLEPGLYELLVEVGGKGCASSSIRLRITYGSGQDVRIEVRDQ